MNKILNTLSQAKNKRRLKVLFTKVIRRLKRYIFGYGNYDTKKIIREKKVDWKNYCKQIDEKLFEEARSFGERMDDRSKDILGDLNVSLGGGGNYVFLYFLTRLRKPSCVIETGVAAGFSSSAFLNAMDENGNGHLYSSDFPYFRIENPEQYIGILVEEKVKDRWSLFVEGDKNNIPKIKKNLDSIDILHYDSDKSYEGREYVFNSLRKYIQDDSIVIYDDIEDNNHFYDLSKSLNRKCIVFEFEGKHVGVIGSIQN